MRILDYTVVGEYGDSKAEFDFVWELRKHTQAEIIWQYPVNPYRIDFLVKGRDLNVAIEVDGKKWHNIKRDSKRDRAILRKDKSINKIIRFEGHDAVYNASFCVNVLAILSPGLFIVPQKTNKRFYTVGELSKRDANLIVNTDHVTKQYDTKLRLHGVYSIQYVEERNRLQYAEHVFKIHFMTPEVERNYFYDDEDKSDVNPLDYTSIKTSKVLIMDRYE